ncbi:MAG: 5,10-methylenetetrahydrofolate reductase [Hyphomicrobiales bacterium]|nr:methylenetetrahydrofolate reductase [Hyphomicrobiales bacterium]PCJ85296.1 MAG: 5,10-methylenetetrahydrofolate reductase [Hyphomicrobiales bacterium]
MMNVKANERTLPVSIEASPTQILKNEAIGELFPSGSWVYLTDVGTAPLETMVAAAKKLKSHGFEAVPHIPARRITSNVDLEHRISALVNEAGVSNVLVIAGEAEHQQGPYASTMDILQSDVLSANGIARIGVAGHPEGNTSISDEMILSSLRAKSDFAQNTDAQMRIVTQFGFDTASFLSWADSLPGLGIDLPVHLGMAGPAKMTTLIKYAAICGVGPSLRFLRKRMSALSALALGYDPEPALADLEAHLAANPASLIQAAHVFPFGGLKKSANWLDERGSWNIKKSLYLDANVI